MTLAKVAPPAIKLDAFLDRALDIAILWESVKEAPIRTMVRKLGLRQRPCLPTGGTLKLLVTVCQVATIAQETVHRWPDESEQVVAKWKPDKRPDVMRRLYALNQLRQNAAHRTGQDSAATLISDLGAFAIGPVAYAAGWGTAVDALHDTLIVDLNGIAALLAPDRDTPD